MNLEVLLMLLIAVSVVAFVGEPWLHRQAAAAPADTAETADHRLEQLLLQKDTLYMAIRDLDFDFRTGKVDQKDYTSLRQQLETDALQILRQLDEVDPLAVLDSELERQILALRQQTPATGPAALSVACCGCGTTLQGSENFCPACGQPVG